MATTFRNKVVAGIGTARTDVLATNDNNRITVVGFSLANLTEGVVLINVEMQDADSTIGYYAKEMVLPPNTSLRVLNGGEKLILTPNNNLFVSSNVADSIDCILSTVEIV
jgi:hypothetical protein|tara:strand:+ start:1620 stop:1949 length:330 start_codon:yes stop_codon:yes gene_type:complete